MLRWFLCLQPLERVQAVIAHMFKNAHHMDREDVELEREDLDLQPQVRQKQK